MSDNKLKDSLREVAITMELAPQSKINEWGVNKLKEKILEKDPDFNFDLLKEDENAGDQPPINPPDQPAETPPVDKDVASDPAPPVEKPKEKVVRTQNLRTSRTKWKYGVVRVGDIKLPKAPDNNEA